MSGLACLGLVLVAFKPLFVCMPQWVDATHYDICARNLLQGGVHYRDTLRLERRVHRQPPFSSESYFELVLPGLGLLAIRAATLRLSPSQRVLLLALLVLAAVQHPLAKSECIQ